MRSPTVAMLWACWRFTRGRLLFLMAILTAGGWVLFDLARDPSLAGPPVLAIVVLLSLVWPVSTRVLGDRSGFPFRADFVRPVSTWLLVAVPMAYLGVGTAAVYLVPLIVLEQAFGVSMPLAYNAVWLSAIVLVVAAGCWWSEGKTARRVGSTAVPLVFVMLIGSGFGPDPRDWLDAAPFDWADYGPLLLGIVAAFTVCLLGVERQRRGDDWIDLFERDGPIVRAVLRRLVELYRYGWGELVRVRCPDSSPIRAELWLEMKYRGAPMLAMSIMIAVLIPLIFQLGNSVGPWIPLVTAAVLPIVPMFVGVSASMWQRTSSGSTPMNAFESTRAVGTARLIGMQVIVTVACTLASWTLIGTSVGLSLPLLGDVQALDEAAAAIRALPGYRLAGMAAIVVTLLATIVAFLLAFKLLTSVFAKRLYVGLLALGLYAMALLLATAKAWVGMSLVEAHLWAAAALVPVCAILLFRRVLLDGVLMLRQAGAAALAWGVFAAIYVLILRSSGIYLSEAPAAVSALWIASSLLPLAAFALAPWALSRVRHA